MSYFALKSSKIVSFCGRIRAFGAHCLRRQMAQPPNPPAKISGSVPAYLTVFLERVSRETLSQSTLFTYPFSFIVRACFEAEI